MIASSSLASGVPQAEASYSAGVTRLRPGLMTALAMICGMLPSALGRGEGGEQNAPIGRAVIGGLFVATATTWFVVPVIYSMVGRRRSTAAAEASLARVAELKAFRQIRAPFDGRVTARNIDVGSLVNPGSGTTARELFRAAQVDTLRAHIQVPQGEAPAVRAGL